MRVSFCQRYPITISKEDVLKTRFTSSRLFTNIKTPRQMDYVVPETLCDRRLREVAGLRSFVVAEGHFSWMAGSLDAREAHVKARQGRCCFCKEFIIHSRSQSVNL